jgi:hypothetical protein
MRNPLTHIAEPEFLFLLANLISTVTHLMIPNAWRVNLGILACVLAGAAILCWLC